MNRTTICIALAVLFAGGCASSPVVFVSDTASPPPSDASVLILPADIEISELGAAPIYIRPRADWSQAATQGLYDALDVWFSERGVKPIRYAQDTIAVEDSDVIRLATINLDIIQWAQEESAFHGIYSVPSEFMDRLDEYGADYALFVTMFARRDPGSGVLLTYNLLTGSLFRAALFDLADGKVVWANIVPMAWLRLRMGNPAEADAERWLRSFETLLHGFPL